MYKRQVSNIPSDGGASQKLAAGLKQKDLIGIPWRVALAPVSYTHLRAHETVLDLVCRLLLAKKNPDKRYAHCTEKQLH